MADNADQFKDSIGEAMSRQRSEAFKSICPDCNLKAENAKLKKQIRELKRSKKVKMGVRFIDPAVEPKIQYRKIDLTLIIPFEDSWTDDEIWTYIMRRRKDIICDSTEWWADLKKKKVWTDRKG